MGNVSELQYYVIKFTTPDRGPKDPRTAIITARSPEAARIAAAGYVKSQNKTGGGGALLSVEHYPAGG